MFRDRQNKSGAGFTLIELLVVIAMIGILATISTPGMIDWKRNANLKADMRRLYGFFQKARLEAVKRNTNCFFVSPLVVNGTTFDYVSYIDSVPGIGVYDDGEETIYTGNFNGGVVATAAFSGSFDRRGLVDANKTIILKGVNGTEHRLVMNIRGRMRIE